MTRFIFRSRVRQLNSRNLYRRAVAAKKLGASRESKAVEPLLSALRSPSLGTLERGDPNCMLRAAAAEALGKIGDVRAIEPLLETMRDDGSLLVRSTAAVALELLGWQPVDDYQRALRAIVLQKWDEVASLGAPAVELLISALQDSSVGVARAALEALGALPALTAIMDTRAVKPLIYFVGHDSDSIGVLAAKALEHILPRLAGTVSSEDLQAAAKLNDIQEFVPTETRDIGITECSECFGTEKYYHGHHNPRSVYFNSTGGTEIIQEAECRMIYSLSSVRELALKELAHRAEKPGSEHPFTQNELQKFTGSNMGLAMPALLTSSSTTVTPRRNVPCPCGSGKKYKRCCGA